MKKILTSISIFFIAMVLFTSFAKAQQVPFSGTIIYDVKAAGEIPEQAKSMIPNEMTFKIAEDKQSMFMQAGMMEQKTIYDAVKQEADMMMDVMGQKLIVKNTAFLINNMKKKDGITTSVKFTNEKKTLAGYSCKKAIVTMKSKEGTETTMDVYYTEDIDVSRYKFSSSFPEINGLPMEFTLKFGPMLFNMVARSIKKESIPASEFLIASDYQEVTTEGLLNMFGMGGQ